MKRFAPSKGTRIIGYICGLAAIPVLLSATVRWNEGVLILGAVLLVLGVVLTYRPERSDG